MPTGGRRIASAVVNEIEQHLARSQVHATAAKSYGRTRLHVLEAQRVRGALSLNHPSRSDTQARSCDHIQMVQPVTATPITATVAAISANNGKAPDMPQLPEWK